MKGIYLENVTLDDLRMIIRDEVSKISSPDEFLTRQEAADLLKKSVSCIDKWAKKGKINPKAIGGAILYSKKELMNSLIEL